MWCGTAPAINISEVLTYGETESGPQTVDPNNRPCKSKEREKNKKKKLSCETNWANYFTWNGNKLIFPPHWC